MELPPTHSWAGPRADLLCNLRLIALLSWAVDSIKLTLSNGNKNLSSSCCLRILWRPTLDSVFFFRQKEPRALCCFKGCLGLPGQGAGGGEELGVLVRGPRKLVRGLDNCRWY